ncbi:MAG: UDP-glucose--hexose-1-phosphate uridylyltransferase, partial [Lactobacillus sp.]|nr:UDP-glucose--hexose-1-phosphate uridylyltransferase [Lactobacillus sp.]
MDKTNLIEKFITQVIAHSDFTELDRIYLRNRILALVGDEARKVATSKEGLLDLKDDLIQAAQNSGKCSVNNSARDVLDAQLMNLIVPRPSVVNHKFWQTYESSPQKAIADFYQMGKDSNYIKTRAIAKNIYFTAASKYGDLEITINLSKPEKDPKEIAAAKNAKANSY